jgi:uncharacterized RDD family membrane protein YckC
VLNPLQFVGDMRRYDTGLLENPALRQVLFNVVLFVPWGVFVRKLFGRGAATAIGTGFLVSLAIETTQLTGVWWLLDCPYRLFDTGDLAANTVGAALGAVLAPVLRGRRHEHAAPDQPRPVRAGRRLLGMVLDLVAVALLGAALTVLVQGGYYLFGDPPRLVTPGPRLQGVLGDWLPAVILLLVVPLAGNGATPGQHAVLLTVARAGGGPASVAQRVVRFLLGSGGYFLYNGFVVVSGHVPGTAGGLWLLVSGLFALFTRGHRGFTGLVAGLDVVDVRRVPASVTVHSAE